MGLADAPHTLLLAAFAASDGESLTAVELNLRASDAKGGLGTGKLPAGSCADTRVAGSRFCNFMCADEASFLATLVSGAAHQLVDH